MDKSAVLVIVMKLVEDPMELAKKCLVPKQQVSVLIAAQPRNTVAKKKAVAVVLCLLKWNTLNLEKNFTQLFLTQKAATPLWILATEFHNGMVQPKVMDNYDSPQAFHEVLLENKKCTRIMKLNTPWITMMDLLLLNIATPLRN